LNSVHLLWIIFILVAVIDTVIYSIEGWISIKFVNLAFPILALISLKSSTLPEKGKSLILIFFVFIVLIGGMLLTGELAQNWSTTCGDIEQGSLWLLSNSNNPTILTDVPTYTKILVVSSFIDLPFSPVYYTLSTYKQIVEPTPPSIDNSTQNEYNYLVIDKKNVGRAVGTLGNRYYEPLSHHYSSGLNNNHQLNKIYSDDRIEVFRVE